MRLIFMGTPDFAVETLKALIAAGHEIICVYSQPPRASADSRPRAGHSREKWRKEWRDELAFMLSLFDISGSGPVGWRFRARRCRRH